MGAANPPALGYPPHTRVIPVEKSDNFRYFYSGRGKSLMARIEAKFAAANPSAPKGAFRVSCYRDGKLQEVRICLNKDLSPRACNANAGVCRLPEVSLLPVR